MGATYVILDLEATCREGGTPPVRMETIEFGAVRFDRSTLAVTDEFSNFVRPVAERQLSDFCVNLTGITQADVDGASGFYEVFPEFLSWLGDGDEALCSWGAYDIRQLEVDCARHGLTFPGCLEEKHWNLKTMFAAAYGIRSRGMERALNYLGIPLDGRHHRGIDDARNIAKILGAMLRDGYV